MKLAFESLNLLQILLQAKIFFLILFKFNEKDLAHKERFCSNSTKSTKDSRHEKPACYYIFCYLKIIKQNLTCLDQGSCMQCCWFPKPLPQEDINSTAVHLQRFRRGILTNPILQSEFEIRFLFLKFHLLFFENQTTCGYLQQLLADFRNIFCTILVAALQIICEKRLLVNHEKTTAN